MPLNITSGDTPIPVEHVNLLIYAPPGTGKTSLAYTAPDPLLLDFDGGAHRSGFRRDTVRIEHWREVAAIDPADIRDYRTIIIDTAGRALDMLTVSLQEDNPKLRTRHGGLTLPGYGELKAAFASWLKMLRAQGKDVVMIAHEKEEKRGDDTVYRADVQGGSYAEIFKLADGVGYLYIGDKGQRVLDFTPTDTHSGKNPANLGAIAYDLMQQPDCLATILQQTKDAVGAIGERSKRIADTVNEYREKIDGAKSATALNKLMAEAKAISERPVQVQVWKLLKLRAAKLDLVFDKETEQFAASESADEAGEKDAA